MASGEKIIGIDLGTTNSCVAVMEGSTAKVLFGRKFLLTKCAAEFKFASTMRRSRETVAAL